MKINLAGILIRSITIMEKTESMAEAVANMAEAAASAAKKCFPWGNHDEINKWYDEHTERGNEKCSKY